MGPGLRKTSNASRNTTSTIVSNSATNIPLVSTESPAVDVSNDTGPMSLGTSKTVRGPTKGKGLRRITKAIGKLPVQILKDKKGPLQPLQAAKLTSELGVIARSIVQVPTKWKDLDEGTKRAGIERLKETLEIDLEDAHVREVCDDKLKTSSRTQRYRLKKKFEKYNTLEEALLHCPKGTKVQNWEALCKKWSTERHKEICEINKKNRSNVKATHTTGSRPYFLVHSQMCAKEAGLSDEAEHHEEVNESEIHDNANMDAIELFKKVHYKADKGWLGKEAELDYDKMLEEKTKAILEDGSTVDAVKIVLEVLGPDSPYVQSMGYAPKVSKARFSRNKVLELQKELDNVRKDRDDMEARLRNTEDMMQSQKSKLEKDLEEVRTDRNELEAELKSTQKQVKTQDSRIDFLFQALSKAGVVHEGDSSMND